MEICNTGLYNIAYFFDYTFRLEEKMAVKYVFVTGGVVSGLGKGHGTFPLYHCHPQVPNR